MKYGGMLFEKQQQEYMSNINFYNYANGKNRSNYREHFSNN